MKGLTAALAITGFALLIWSFLPAPSTVPVATPATTSVVTTSIAGQGNADVGRALFAAKGCGMCHVNRRAIRIPAGCCTDMGPNLTNYTNQAEYLRRWLADPAALKPETQMPNLNLSSAEIEDLVAFLNEPR